MGEQIFAPLLLGTMDDETLDREELSSIDDVQLLADRPAAGIYRMLVQQDGRLLRKQNPRKNEDYAALSR